MSSPRKRPRRFWITITRRFRALALLVAAFPLFQSTGCFPDPIGALNFELQSLVNTVIINAINTIVINLLGI